MLVIQCTAHPRRQSFVSYPCHRTPAALNHKVIRRRLSIEHPKLNSVPVEDFNLSGEISLSDITFFQDGASTNAGCGRQAWQGLRFTEARLAPFVSEHTIRLVKYTQGCLSQMGSGLTRLLATGVTIMVCTPTPPILNTSPTASVLTHNVSISL